jgi:tRNA(Ile)-lysidine synthase
MLRRIVQTIAERDLIRPGDHIVAGCSGGADSVALVYALWFLQARLNFHLSVAHLHHGLRGKPADADARLVDALCARLALPLITEKISVRAVKARQGGSVEMAARAARHDFFRRVLEQTGANAIALAHHRNDQAETVLMRLLSGSGLEGLGGMDYRAEPSPGVTVIRPLLDATRDQITAFLVRHKLAWREDATNRDPAMLRNRIRHRILPSLVREGFPQVVNALTRLSDVVREETNLAAAQTRRRRLPGHGDPLPVNNLASVSIAEQRRFIRAWLSDVPSGARALDFQTTEKIRALVCDGATGTVPMGRGASVSRVGEALAFGVAASPTVRAPVLTPVVLAVPGVTDLPGTAWSVCVTATRGFRRSDVSVGTIPCEVYLRREVGKTPPLMIRARRPGDRFTPTGMPGTVTLKDLFIDQKVPVSQRALVPVLSAGDDVVWVAGYRVAARWAVEGANAPSWRVRIERKTA